MKIEVKPIVGNHGWGVKNPESLKCEVKHYPLPKSRHYSGAGIRTDVRIQTNK